MNSLAYLLGYASIQGLSDRLDARKTTLSTGKKIPGKKCGGSYIAAPYKCSKNSADQEKVARQELAGKVRKAKGLAPAADANTRKRHRTIAEEASKRAAAAGEQVREKFLADNPPFNPDKDFREGGLSMQDQRSIHSMARTKKAGEARARAMQLARERYADEMKLGPDERFLAVGGMPPKPSRSSGAPSIKPKAGGGGNAPIPVRSKGAQYIKQSGAKWLQEHRGAQAIAHAFDHDIPIDTHAYAGKARVQRMNPPSKKYPYGSVSVKSERDGSREVFDFAVLSDQVRSQGNSLGRNTLTKEQGRMAFEQSELGRQTARYFGDRTDSVRSFRVDADEPAKELSQLIVSALEDGYTSGIEALLSYSLEGDTIFGRFRDEGKTFGYTLKDKEIAYWQLKGQERTDSLIEVPVYRADKQRMKGAKGKKCTIGTKCRYGCISGKKVCRLQPSPSAKGFIKKAVQLAKTLIDKITKKVKPEQESKPAANDVRAVGRTRFSKEQRAVLNRSRAERDRRAQERNAASNIKALQKRRSDAFERGQAWAQAFVDRLDARKTTLSTGKKIPGKRCGGSYIAAPYKCSKNSGAQEKAARKELAGKVRKIKGFKEMSTPNRQAKEPPIGFSSERNQQAQQKSEAEFIKRGGGSLVNRGMQQYSSEGRARLQASTRAGHRQRDKIGEHFYLIPEKPTVAFSTRGQAARAQYHFYKSHQAAQIHKAPVQPRPQPTTLVNNRFSIDSEDQRRVV